MKIVNFKVIQDVHDRFEIESIVEHVVLCPAVVISKEIYNCESDDETRNEA